MALIVVAALTCSGTSGPAEACPTPLPGSTGERALAQAQAQASFPIRYPCYMPAAQRLESATVTGPAGRQQVELIFAGPFELTIRQAQFAPQVNPDPTGASRSQVDIFPNVKAILIERNDGSQKALYHLFWSEGGMYYEVQAVGPPLQRRAIIRVATSLQ